MDYVAVWSLLQCAFPGFTDRALELLSAARDLAEARHHALVTPEHVLQALTAIQPGVGRVALERLGIEFERDGATLAALASAAQPASPDECQAFSGEAEQMLTQARAASREMGHRWVGTEHLVLGLLCCGPCPAGDYLRGRGVTGDKLRAETLRLLAGNC
jgi:ATP-dependent Clp protease ATP-binding subunit ClpC